jgi:hypothetical protein
MQRVDGENHVAAGSTCGIGGEDRASPEEHGDSQGMGGWGLVREQSVTEYATFRMRKEHQDREEKQKS